MAWTVTVTRGKTFTSGVAYTTADLNAAALPTVVVAGTIAGSDIGANTITASNLAASVAGAGLAGAAGTPLSVTADEVTLTVVADAVKVKDGGVGNPQVAAAAAIAVTKLAVTTGKIVGGAASAGVELTLGTGLEISGTTLQPHKATGTAAVPASSGVATFAHGLTTVPSFWSVRLLQNTASAQAGYAQNDEVEIGVVTAGGDNKCAWAVAADATNITVARRNDAALNVVPKTGGVWSTALTEANWLLKFVVWK